MAAFCSCCGAEITLKAGACPVCGTPRHGMLPKDEVTPHDLGTNAENPDAPEARSSRRSRL